jgi:hypothetical protein
MEPKDPMKAVELLQERVRCLRTRSRQVSEDAQRAIVDAQDVTSLPWQVTTDLRARSRELSATAVAIGADARALLADERLSAVERATLESLEALAELAAGPPS